MLLVPGPRAGTPGLRTTHAIVTNLALQLLPCVHKLQQTFELWDDDGQGTFNFKDFRKALAVVGAQAEPADVQLLFDLLDRHRSGTAVYRSLGQRLAHVAGVVGAPTPSVSTPSLPTLGRGRPEASEGLV